MEEYLAECDGDGEPDEMDIARDWLIEQDEDREPPDWSVAVDSRQIDRENAREINRKIS
jgi:hypothetical protein